MRVLVLGADGYLGWPTAMYLSARGHDVIAADSLIRRRWDQELGTESLTPIASMEQRIDRWAELTGRGIWWQPVDLCDLRRPRS
jgi:UDP-sulfoquinovose synthase